MGTREEFFGHLSGGPIDQKNIILQDMFHTISACILVMRHWMPPTDEYNGISHKIFGR